MDVRLYQTTDYYIFRKSRHSLWCSKTNGQLIPRFDGEESEEDVDGEEELVCTVYGLFGKIRLLSDTDWRLLVITKATSIGKLPLGDEIYKVDEVDVLTLSNESYGNDGTQQRGGEYPKRSRSSKETVEKLEKRLLEALARTINSSDSFFFTYDGDLTNTIQRRKLSKDRQDIPQWAKADERFFWNKSMLNDLMGPNYKGSLCDPWILPIVQGYVEIQSCPLHTIVGHVPEGLLPQTDVAQTPSPPLVVVSMEVSKEETEEDKEENGCLGDDDNRENPVINDSELRGVSTGHTSSISTVSLLLSTKDITCEEDDRQEQPPLHPLVSPSMSDTVQQTNEGDCQTSDEHTLALDLESDEDSARGSRHSGSSHLSFHSRHFDMSRDDVEEEGLDVGVVISNHRSDVFDENIAEDNQPHVTFVIISRRSWHRAGMRYKKRGADTSGAAANYVETEFITMVASHCTSITMVRGSVPIVWSQPGYKYKPPPIVEKDHQTNLGALECHFSEQLARYQQVCVINTLNQSGQEKKLSDAYEEYLIEFNSTLLQYVAFDFHRICHGSLQIQNVQILLDNIKEITKSYRFCWLDIEQNAILSEQQGVYRVNCLDCLDRTNVVQSYVAKEVLLTMLMKLGLMNPDEPLSEEVTLVYNQIWANNGDAISRQYAGTAAMKGDLTRHGERKISGMMRDGYNSAYRYYLNIFSYKYRQFVIDLMLGGSPNDILKSVLQDNNEEEDILSEGWSLEREEAVIKMVDHCRSQLYPYYDPDKVKGYALCEPAGQSFLQESDFEENVVLLLYQSKPEITMANYDISKYEITSFIRIQLEYVNKIEIGSLGNMLRNSRRPHIRLYYMYDGLRQTYFTFKTVAFASVEEDNSILEGIAAEIQKCGPHIDVFRNRIDRKRCPPHQGVVYLRLPKELLDELAIKASRSSVLHEKVTVKDRPPIRDAFSDDELLDRSDNYGDSLDNSDMSDDDTEQGSEGNRTRSLTEGKTGNKKPLEERDKKPLEERNKMVYSCPDHENVGEEKKTGVDNDKKEQKEVKRKSKRSPNLSSKLKRMHLARKEKKLKNASSRSRSPSPSPQSQSSQQSLRAPKNTAKDFLLSLVSDQEGLSKFKSRVLSKLSNAPSSDKEEDDPAEIRRQERWKNSKIKSILI